MVQRDEDGLAVVVVSGPGAIERAVFGLASALAAAVSGVDVRVILSAEGTYWCASGSGQGEEVPDFPTIDELLNELHLLGVRVDACSESIAHYCELDDEVRPWIHRVERAALIDRVHGLNAVIC